MQSTAKEPESTHLTFDEFSKSITDYLGVGKTVASINILNGHTIEHYAGYPYYVLGSNTISIDKDTLQFDRDSNFEVIVSKNNIAFFANKSGVAFEFTIYPV